MVEVAGIETAAIACLLACGSECVNPEDAVLAGLIHDIGIFMSIRG